MDSLTTPGTEKLSKYELLRECRRATIAAGLPYATRWLYQTAAELSYPIEGIGWVLRYDKYVFENERRKPCGFSQRSLCVTAGVSPGIGCQMYRRLFQHDWFGLCEFGPVVTPHRGRAVGSALARHGQRASAPRAARERATGSAQARHGQRASAPRAARDATAHLYVFQNTEMQIEAEAEGAAAAEASPGEVKRAMLAMDGRRFDDPSQHDAMVAEIIQAARRVATQNESLSSETVMKWAWRQSLKCKPNPVGRFRKVLRDLAAGTITAETIEQSLATTAQTASTPRVVIEAKPEPAFNIDDLDDLARKVCVCVGDEAFARYFHGLAEFMLEEHTIKVCCKTSYAADWIERRFKERLEAQLGCSVKLFVIERATAGGAR